METRPGMRSRGRGGRSGAFVSYLPPEDAAPRQPLKGVGASSKLNADGDFLVHLRDMGRETATVWLKRNGRRIAVALADAQPAYRRSPVPIST